MIKFGATQAGALSTLQYASISANVAVLMPSDAFGALKPEIIKGLNFTNFTSTQVANLSPDQAAGLTSKQIALLDSTDVKGFRVDALAAIKPEAIKGLAGSLVTTPSQTSASQTGSITGLGSEAVAALTTAQLNALSSDQLEQLTATQVQYLTDTHLAFLNSKGKS